MNIIFAGIQGCGKGTQARILSEKYGIPFFEMGSEFRREINSGSDLGNKIKEVIDSLVPESLGKMLMKEVIEKNKDNEITIYDGFIREKWNLELFEQMNIDFCVIFFELPKEISLERLSSRMFDPITSETFPNGIKVNPKTGTKLVRRKDDASIKSVNERIEAYYNKTLPLIEELNKQGKVFSVDANQPIEKVTSDIEEILDLK